MPIGILPWDNADHLTSEAERKVYLEAALEDGYRAMANDKAREADAIEWIEAVANGAVVEAS